MERDVPDQERCIIVGAGPAGLTAAWEAQRLGIPALVLEKDDGVGGLSRTVVHEGFRFDIGGHRFFTKVDEVRALWHELLGADFLQRPRLSRIYYGGRFFDYPIRPWNALRGLGPLEAVRIVASYAAAQLFPHPHERSFEEWVSNRFGRRLYEIFFKTYTEKVWGLPCSEIGSEWAAQRIRDLDLAAALRGALLGSARRDGRIVTTLIDQFEYPRLGPGMLWERCRERVEARGGEVRTGREVVRVRHDGRRVLALEVRRPDGSEEAVAGGHFLSSMPIRQLVNAFDPPPPAAVLAAANRLRYRDFLTVALLIDRADLFPDNWIYVHAPSVRVGRIQNFKNWSPEMVPDPSRTALGLEYFVQEGDDLWRASDEVLVDLARRECVQLGLVDGAEVREGVVVRVPKAYPVYDAGYREALRTVRAYLDGFANLQLIGRNGQHRYNNQDHSMVTALYAVRNLAGARYDVWDVNVEQDYHEEVRAPARDGGDRLVPGSPARRVDEEIVRGAFARYDPLALAVAVGVVLGAVIFLVTAIPLLRGDADLAPRLSLLSGYLLGYRPSWAGAWLALAEGGVLGFFFGGILAHTINAVIGVHEGLYRREVELARSLAALEEERPT